MRSFIWGKAFVRAFKRAAKKYPALNREIADTLRLLQENPFAPQLATHKLKGKLAESWACSAGYDLRIICASSLISSRTPINKKTIFSC